MVSFNKKLSFKLDAKFLTKNISIIFWLLLVCLILGEIFVIKNSVDIVLGANEQQVAAHGGGVRINFDSYAEVANRLNNAKVYQPAVESVSNPFLPVPEASSTPGGSP